MSKASVFKTTTFKTSVLYKKEGEWALKPLPFEAQLSPVFAIEIADIDKDGILDIVLGGNYYKLKPEIGRLDGFDGGYFKGNGDGSFDFISALKSGIQIKGEVRDIKMLGEAIIFARNNNSVITFARKK